MFQLNICWVSWTSVKSFIWRSRLFQLNFRNKFSHLQIIADILKILNWHFVLLKNSKRLQLHNVGCGFDFLKQLEFVWGLYRNTAGNCCFQKIEKKQNSMLGSQIWRLLDWKILSQVTQAFLHWGLFANFSVHPCQHGIKSAASLTRHSFLFPSSENCSWIKLFLLSHNKFFGAVQQTCIKQSNKSAKFCHFRPIFLKWKTRKAWGKKIICDVILSCIYLSRSWNNRKSPFLLRNGRRESISGLAFWQISSSILPYFYLYTSSFNVFLRLVRLLQTNAEQMLGLDSDLEIPAVMFANKIHQ